MSDLKQFNDLSSWREDNITIESGEVFTLDFLDTRPNMFVIQNPNNVVLKCAISVIPRVKNYEFKVEKNTTETIGRPTPTNKIHILNTGDIGVSIKVFSVNTAFDMSVLKNMNVSIDSAIVETDGIVKGFESGVSIPSGNNSIGKIGFNDYAQVDIDSIKTYLSNLTNDSSTIKPYHTETAHNSRYILQILNGSYAKENIVKNIADCLSSNFENFIFNGENNSTLGSLLVKIAEKIVSDNSVGFSDLKTAVENIGISSVININEDALFKKTLVESREYIKKNIRTITSFKAFKDFNENQYIKVTTTAENVALNTAMPIEGNLKVDIMTGASTIYILTYTPTSGTALTKTLSQSAKELKLYNGGYYVKASVIYELINSNVGYKSGNTSYIETFERSSYSLSGALAKARHISDWYYSGVYEISGNSAKEIFDEYTNTAIPVKIMDRIENISLITGSSCYVDIFTNNTDYFSLLLNSANPIKELECEVYGLRIRNVDTNAISVNIVGGLY